MPKSNPPSLSCEDFNRLVSQWVENGELPGAHHLIFEEGRLVNQQIVGYSHLETNTLLHERSLYRLASATKIFLSVGALVLVDEGAMALHDPVHQFLPEYEHLQLTNDSGILVASDKVMTIEDLLRHSCGFGYGDTEPYKTRLREANLLGVDDRGSNHWLHELPLRDWARALAAIPLETEPGTAVSYGLGHDILGAVLEEVSGLTLDAFMQQRVFLPLGLQDTFFVVPESRQVDLTSFYNVHAQTLKLVESASDSGFRSRPLSFSGGGGWDMLGNGGLVSSAADFVRLLNLIVHGGEFEGTRLLSAESAALLMSSRTRELAQSEMMPGCDYSFGLASVENIERYAGNGPVGKMWWGGSTNTYFFMVPATQRVGVFLTHTFPFAHRNAIYRFDRLAQT